MQNAPFSSKPFPGQVHRMSQCIQFVFSWNVFSKRTQIIPSAISPSAYKLFRKERQKRPSADCSPSLKKASSHKEWKDLFRCELIAFLQECFRMLFVPLEICYGDGMKGSQYTLHIFGWAYLKRNQKRLRRQRFAFSYKALQKVTRELLCAECSSFHEQPFAKDPKKEGSAQSVRFVLKGFT